MSVQIVNFPFKNENWISGDTLSKSVVTIVEAGLYLTASNEDVQYSLTNLAT